MSQNQKTFKATYFQEGHELQVEVAAILKSTKHLNLSIKFLKFLLTPDIQSIIASHGWMYPAISQTANISLPKSYQNLKQPRPLNIEIGMNKNKMLKTWEQIN